MHTKLYKVLTNDEWEAVSQSGQIITQLDHEDGFVHLSSAGQLNMTLSLYFSQEESVVLLELDEQEIEASLTYQYSAKRGGEFAHFYGELSIMKILQLWHLNRNAFSLPSEVMLKAEQV